MDQKRRDNKGRLLFKGETQESDGRYRFKYTDAFGVRKSVYSWRLTEADSVPKGKRMDIPLREKEKKIIALRAQGVVGSKMTVLELVEKYISLKTGVKHNTMANYRFVINVLRKEEFGRKPMENVKLSDAKSFLIKLQKDGRGFSSIHSIRGVLRPAFQMAVEDDLILKNPFGFELGGVIINDSVAREALSDRDVDKYMNFIKNDNHYSRYYDAFMLLLKTGIRISEFCGLTIGDIDFENGVIDINHQLQRTRNMNYVIETTKTTSGTRKIPMTDEVRMICERIIENRKCPRKEPIVDGYCGFLYLDKNGNPMVAQHWEKYIQLSRIKYNKTHRIQLPKITPHVLRHTFCSNMAKQGISPKALQYLMGHSDIAVTLNVYTHIGLDDARSELDKINSDVHKVVSTERFKQEA